MSFHHTYTINFNILTFQIFGDWWLIPVSGVGRNGFPDKFSTQMFDHLLEFLIFLQTVFCNFFTNLLAKKWRQLFWISHLKNFRAKKWKKASYRFYSLDLWRSCKRPFVKILKTLGEDLQCVSKIYSKIHFGRHRKPGLVTGRNKLKI